MANPNVRIKRSSVAGKRPTIAQLELGELALNTNDGRLFTRKYNVGIGSTVTLLNPWTENIGGSVYYNDGFVGIGTDNPINKFQVGYAGTYVSFAIDSNGNLGVGTITPTTTITDGVAHRTLHFYSPDSRQVSLRLDNGNVGGNAWMLQSSGGDASNGQGKFSIYDVNNDSYRFTIDSNGDIGIGTDNPSYKLEVLGSRAWFKPNQTGIEEVALSIGTFSDQNAPFYDILTNDATADSVTHRINRFTGSWKFNRTSPLGEQNAIDISSYHTTGTSVSIGNSIGNTQIYFYTNGNSYFNNDGAVLVGSATSTNTVNQKLQVTGGAYVSGDVGIGVTNPQSSLEVNSKDPGGGIRVSSTGTNSPGFRLINNDTVAFAQNLLALNSGHGLVGSVSGDYCIRNSGGGGILLGISTAIGFTNPNEAIGYVRLTPSGELLVGTSSTITTGTASQPLQVYGGSYISGNVGIGTTNPTSRLHIQGDALITGVTTSTDFNSASDIRLKENIKPIENPIDKILNITGVSFDWKETGRSSMGVIAQEIENVLPELVNNGDTKTVNYNGLIGLLIEVVKEQQKEINNLKEKL